MTRIASSLLAAAAVTVALAAGPAAAQGWSGAQSRAAADAGRGLPAIVIGQESFRRLDRNHDNRLTPDELADQSDATLSLLDGDRDGVVSRQEFGEALRQTQGRLELAQPGSGRDTASRSAAPGSAAVAGSGLTGGPGAPAAAGGSTAPGAAAHFAAIDRNGDGVISRDEFMAGAPQTFSLHDLNGDGRITPDEYGRLMRQ